MGELLTRFGEAFATSGMVALAAALAWGVLSVVLSPCHLSSVPLVVAVFGAALGPCTFAFMAPLLGIAFRASGAGAVAYGVLLVALYGIGHAAAIAIAGASLQSVNRWLGWRAGARAVAAVKMIAGVAVTLGGAYFVWTAV